MTEYFRRYLGAKLLLSYLIIIVGVIVLIVASQFILPTSFNRHMAGMGMLDDMMGNQGMGNSDTMSQLYLDYRVSLNEALVYAALAAMVVAIGHSLYLSRNVIASVRAKIGRASCRERV